MTEKRSSVQVLSRAAALLRVVSSAMPGGISTTEAARKTEIARPTVHRILASLATEGFCDQDAQTGYWLLGPRKLSSCVESLGRYFGGFFFGEVDPDVVGW